MRVRATSPITKACRKRAGMAVTRAVSLRVSCTSGRLACQAGAKPKKTPVRMDTSAVNASTLVSSSISFARGRASPLMPRINPSPQFAKRNPRTPPASESKRLSVSSWRMIRQRPAPSAARTAISLCRVEARAKSRFATLPHAINSTIPTAPRIVQSVARTVEPTRFSIKVSIRTPQCSQVGASAWIAHSKESKRCSSPRCVITVKLLS